MTRTLAITGYVLGIVAAGFFSFAYFTANAHLSFGLSINHTVWTAIPIIVLLAAGVIAQALSTKFRLPLVLLVVAATMMLIVSMLLHAFPDRAVIASVIHLALVVAGVLSAMRFLLSSV